MRSNRRLLITIKDIYFFFSFSITISGKNINFRHKKFRNRDFYENQKVFKIDDIDVDKNITWHKQII